jgi:HD superfamily phosphohydrolase
VGFVPDLAISIYGHLSEWYKARMTGTEGALRPDEHEKPPGTKVFRDPIHDLIYLGPEDRWILDLIDTKEFQRLRRIRQLGLAHFAYPGAEHSRFTHSLGVFNFARRMIRKLQLRHSLDETILNDLEAHERTIKAAALLHDLGHGPFSHVFERVLTEVCKNAMKHDEWSCRILRDEQTEVHQKLVEHNVDIESVCGLISDSAEPPREPYRKDIVSSQLDADRMDYLLRDSWMTGSKYGRFDSE